MAAASRLKLGLQVPPLPLDIGGGQDQAAGHRTGVTIGLKEGRAAVKAEVALAEAAHGVTPNVAMQVQVQAAAPGRYNSTSSAGMLADAR